MRSRWDALLRFVNRLAQVLAVTATATIFVTVLAFFLAANGGDPRPLRALVRAVGQGFAAQRTEHIDVSVQVIPDTHRLSAVTTLTLRSIEEQRPHFVFLLNPLLKLRTVSMEVGGERHTPAVYRLSWITIVEPAAPVPRDQTVKIKFDYEGTFPATFAEPIPTEINARGITLGPEAFWYPTDAQSFFTADVHVTLPRTFTLAHSSSSATRVDRGDLQVVHWSSTRPIAAIPIVAGAFRISETRVHDINYRLYLADDVDLDANTILEHMSDADRFLSGLFGASGFDTVSIYVSRDLRRGVNYGCGLIGLSTRYFRSGDLGYALVAHEIAHNWWGATVAEQWLNPGTGGQWIVEGLAELSSLIATEHKYGDDALTRRLTSELFDPQRQKAIRDMSMLDNIFNETSARDTIYRKGSYTAFRLCDLVGRESCYQALRELVDKNRYTQATDVEIQKAFESVTGSSLDAWFADWVRSDALADLQLVADDTGALVVHSDGKIKVGTETLPLWVLSNDDPTPKVVTTRVGEKVDLQAGQVAVLDPQLRFPDVVRGNNRHPRAEETLYATAAPGNAILLTQGEPWPWSATKISLREGSAVAQSWDLPRAVLQPPTWFPDGTQILVSYSDPERSFPTILALAVDGTRRTVGSGTSPAVAADGSVYTARKERIFRIAPDGSESNVATRSGWVLDQPLPAPDGSRVAYIAARHNRIELRLAVLDGSSDRLLLTWDRDRTVLRWAPQGDKLYAVVAGDSDWQLWEIPLDQSATRVLVRDATSIGDFALSPDGSQIAITATPEPGFPVGRRELYLLAVNAPTPRHIVIPDTNPDGVSWNGADTLIVSGARITANQPWSLPQTRVAKIVAVADGSVRDHL